MSIGKLWWQCWRGYLGLFALMYLGAVYAVTPPTPVDLPWFPNLVLGVLAVFMLLWWIVALIGLVICRQR